MVIDLPKDATGREIPLDTKVLYNENGDHLDVNRFTYSVVQTIPGLKWGVVFMDCVYDYCCSFYLKPPEPPDSWKALENDLERSFKSTSYTPCAYFQPDCGSCDKCLADYDNNCMVQMFEHIVQRVHKLRGDGK